MADRAPLMPPIADDSGYQITDADLMLLGLEDVHVEAWRERSCPLGMTEEIYLEFRRSLLREVDLLDGHDADVILQGSSAHFFAGKHKTMPYKREELIKEFFESGQGRPSRVDIDKLERTVNQHWAAPTSRPLRRPFDVLAKLRVHSSPSDYDVQISSESLVIRIVEEFRELGADVPDDFRVNDTHYGYVKKAYVTEYLPSLDRWIGMAERLTGRPVSIALFDGDGPRARLPEGDMMSSHFQPNDWIMRAGEGRASGG